MLGFNFFRRNAQLDLLQCKSNQKGIKYLKIELLEDFLYLKLMKYFVKVIFVYPISVLLLASFLQIFVFREMELDYTDFDFSCYQV